MVKCPFCQISYVENTLFCTECGYYLLDNDKRETDRLEEEEEASWAGPPKSFEPVFAPEVDSRLLTLRLKIGAKKRIVETPLDKVIHIGRLDPNLNIFPEIDVTDDIAPEKNVSRRHARILKQGSKIVVEDLGSVNGTFVNSKKLEPYLPETLVTGDTLQLGALRIEIEILS